MHPVPKARRWEIRFCGFCPNAHLIFYDSDGLAMCDATISIQHAKKIITAIQENDPNFRDVRGSS